MYDAGVYAAKTFMTWNRGIKEVCCISGIHALYRKITIETEHYSEIALYPIRNFSAREQTQATNTLGCGEALREMMHVLSHTDICS